MTILDSFKSDYWFYIYRKKDNTKPNSSYMVDVFNLLIHEKELQFYKSQSRVARLQALDKNQKWFMTRRNFLFSVFSYIQYPSFIERKFAKILDMKEQKYWYIFIVVQWDYVFVKKTSWLNSLNKDDLWNLSLKKLEKVEKDRLLQRYDNLVDLDIKNTRVGGYSSQRISVDKNSLVDVTPVQQMYNYYTKKTKVRGNDQSSLQSLSINNWTSRCAYSAIDQEWNKKNLVKYCSNINAWLTADKQNRWTVVSFLEHFTQPVGQDQINDIQDFNDGFFYFDLNRLRNHLREDNELEQTEIDIILEGYSAAYSLRVVSEEQEDVIQILAEGNNEIWNLRMNNGELRLAFNDNFWSAHRYNQIIIRNELYFAFGQNYTYSEWNFYQRRTFENDYNTRDLTSIFKNKLWTNTCWEKNYLRFDAARNQKRRTGLRDATFHVNSIFGQLESILPDEYHERVYLVCWDLWQEVADYMLFSDNEICLIHAKSNNKINGSNSVSDFQDVVGQALKNIWELDNIDNLQMKLSAEYLNGNFTISHRDERFPEDNYTQEYQRMRFGNSADICNLRCRRNVFLRKKIILAVDFFTINGITTFLEGEDSHAKRQMTNLLLELVLSAKSRGIDVEIRCKKDN